MSRVKKASGLPPENEAEQAEEGDAGGADEENRREQDG